MTKEVLDLEENSRLYIMSPIVENKVSNFKELKESWMKEDLLEYL